MSESNLRGVGAWPPGPAPTSGRTGYELGADSALGQKTPEAQLALMNAAGLADRARMLDDRLATLHARLFGPTPMATSGKAEGPSNGFFADLATQHDAADGALHRAADTLAQIERAFP